MSRTQRHVPYWAPDSLRDVKAELPLYLKRVKKCPSLRNYGKWNNTEWRVKNMSAVVRGDDGKHEKVIGVDFENEIGFDQRWEVWGQGPKKAAKKWASRNRRHYAKNLAKQELLEFL